MQEDGSDAGSVVEVLPQEQITMLLNKQDFNDKVGQDTANLCCVLVSSTICRQCGIRRIPYPKAPPRNADGTVDEDGAEEEGEEAEGDEEEGGSEDGACNTGGASGGHFYRDFEEHLVRKAATAVQRRHVRFFHVCACAAEETCIDVLMAADPAFSVLNKKPTPHEIAQLHQTAHRQLYELLALLEVRSTPQMRFYLAGQPLRYSMMSSVAGGGAPAGVTAANDLIMATGANRVKWARVLENAVVVRNAVMRDYDAEEKEKARLARAAAKRLAREERRRQEAEEGEEEEEEDNE
ncbi:hypothetical protein ABB37_03438 [Leptomonas pyrrhocoris]|uniref:Uncharacterized protein n=1 Tax=Leptomonas pyrrhocoris TaxID=157538 RepID=A0A0M9G560_LEPPY|nr:hypothetical protein ABB37_03438 [Leptomonas pyrrhocoris]KPA82349.1 hypothetical protein ABB37_03438 [Leptomonas pyrrhocoris]|eukprot:XP_015660788.1 hypothetical protein ABB37_03438 [Leptomonas pyrrhocoris]